jgi:basic amino acid/polyamine antiporter, APA family
LASTDQDTERPGAKLGLFAAVALVMGNMIGSGVFLLPASLAAFGWNAVPGWIITIAGALCLAYVIGQLSARHDRPMGPAALVEHSFGHRAGFLIGFSFWISVFTGNATIAVGAISYLSSFAPALAQYPAVAALGVIWAVTAINLFSLRAASAFQIVTLALKLLPLLVVAVLIAAVLSAKGGAALAPLPMEGFSLTAINSAAALALWAMVGFEAACGASDKIANPHVNVARATMIGAALTGLVYLVICSGIALMLPQADVVDHPAPFALFVDRFWSAEAAALVGLFAAISAIGAVNGWTLVQGELPREMAARGMMPGWFGMRLANGVAGRALIVSSILSSALVLANSSRTMAGLFAFMALLTTSVTLLLYLACALAALKERTALLPSALGVVFGLWCLYGAGVEAAGLAVALMLSGLPLYVWTRAKAAATTRA